LKTCALIYENVYKYCTTVKNINNDLSLETSYFKWKYPVLCGHG